MAGCLLRGAYARVAVWLAACSGARTLVTPLVNCLGVWAGCPRSSAGARVPWPSVPGGAGSSSMVSCLGLAGCLLWGAYAGHVTGCACMLYCTSPMPSVLATNIRSRARGPSMKADWLSPCHRRPSTGAFTRDPKVAVHEGY